MGMRLILGFFTLFIGGLTPLAASTPQIAEQKEAVSGLGYATGLIDDGLYDEALGSLRQTPMKTDAEVGEVFLEMAKLYAALGNLAKATEAIATASELLSSENPRVTLERARVDILSGNLLHARRSLARLQDEPSLPAVFQDELVILQARGQMAVGGYDAAQRVLSQGQASDRLVLEQAKLLEAAGQLKRAKAVLQEYAASAPNSGRVWLKLAQVSRALGEVDASAAAIRRAENLFTQVNDKARLSELERIASSPVIAGKQDAPRPGARGSLAKAPPPPQAPPTPPTALPAPPTAVVPSTPPVATPVAPFPPAVPPAANTPPEPAPAPPPVTTVTPSIRPFPFSPGAKIKTGSGFVIDQGRRVVTNRHVVEEGTDFYVRNSLGDFSKVTVERVGKTDDLAILLLEKPFPTERAIDLRQFAPARAGANIAVLGFPLTGILGSVTPSITNGIVIKVTGMRDDPATFQLSAKMNRGNSGGAVVNSRGQVIGVAMSKLDVLRIMQGDGFLPEDINFAVHVQQLKGLGLPIQPASNTTHPEMSLEEIYQRFIGSVVMVAGR